MRTISIADFDDWRLTARKLISEQVSPSDIKLLENNGQKSLFGSTDLPIDSKPVPPTFHVPQKFVGLAKTVGYHRDSNRWNLLYRTLWRIKFEHSKLLEIETDDEVHRLHQMEKQVRRDAHKMKAFVRFRKIEQDGDEYFIAWHQPDHRIVRRVAPFFSRRFAGMNWSILTPDESVSWDQQTLHYSEGVSREDAPQFDELEDLWRTYYANIFNPARVKVRMMKSEMPVRYWKNLPEAEIIDELLAEAPQRVVEMIQRQEGFKITANEVITRLPTGASWLESLKELARACDACDLYQHATQTVFGKGPADAKIVFLGEQPGDEEDIAGRPFVGPAGRLLDDVLQTIDLDRSQIYLTNVVKHFKYSQQLHAGSEDSPRKKRLHQRPNAREIRCCRHWFEAEWRCLNQAQSLVCLGLTAAKTILGPGIKLSDVRGQIVPSEFCPNTLVTWHPSAILRTTDTAQRERKIKEMKSDLRLAVSFQD